MNLEKIRIENFQGILNSTDISLKQLTVLVGRNDVGKSTLLKGLDFFLNGTIPSADSRNANAENSTIIIELAFTRPDNYIIIDEAIQTNFLDELLLDETGLLRIRKEWDVSAAKPTAKTFIRRTTFGHEDFLLLTEKELIKKCEKLGLNTKKANGDEHSNVEKRKKLRTLLMANSTQSNFEWLLLPSSGTNRAKLIHDAIKGLLPSFQYFKADSSLSESDIAIQRYFRSVANTALAANGMLQIENNARNALQLVLDSVTSKINSVVSESEKVEVHVDFDWAKAISTTFKTTGNQANIPLTQRGDGFRRITMMAYFEHLAEENANEGEKIIFGFEEPETFLHPTAQEQLFEKLEGLCEAGHQVLLTSHSPIIVARTKSPSLIHVKKDSGTTQYIDNIQDIHVIANDLGIKLDNQFISLFDKAKALFLVEGIDDAIAFAHLANKYKIAGKIPSTFEELGIVLLPIGGCGSIQHWVQLDLLKKLTKPFFIFLDSDKEVDTATSSNGKALTDLGFILGINCALSKKRTLENYISSEALNRLVEGANINYGDYENVKDICKKHPLAGKLGGKKVAEKYFCELTFEDLKSTYCANGVNDEFLEIYSAVNKILI